MVDAPRIRGFFLYGILVSRAVKTADETMG